jgi:thiosulfate dehydrogenase
MHSRTESTIASNVNGNPLPYDSDEMPGILTYIWWLSRDVPTGVAVKGRGFARLRSESPAR